MVDLQSLIIKVDRGIHGLQIQVHAAREEIERAERHRKVVADEAGQIQTEIAELKEKRRRGAVRTRAAEAARIEAASRTRTRSVRARTKRVTRPNAANTVLNEKRMVAATSDERRRSAVSALRRVENESKELESRLAVQTSRTRRGRVKDQGPP